MHPFTFLRLHKGTTIFSLSFYSNAFLDKQAEENAKVMTEIIDLFMKENS